MKKQLHYENLNYFPVIAAVRTPDAFKRALESAVKVISVVGGDFFQLAPCMEQAAREEKTVFLHMDLIEGIGRDAGGIRFAREQYAVAGIHSTKSHMIKLAKEENMITIHRLFITDFQSIESGLNMIRSSRPDYVEIAPGTLPRIVRKFRQEQKSPVISSGLIENEKDLEILTRAGASNFVCSKEGLWNLNVENKITGKG